MAVRAIRALLVASPSLVAIVPAAKIVFGVVPQATILPAISIMHVSTVGLPTIDAQSAATLSTSRVQVTAMAKDYATIKSILAAARLACQFKRGALGGVSVSAITVDTLGPDFQSEDALIFYQSIDFKVTFEQPNQ